MPSTTSSKSAIKFFDERYFARDVCAELTRKLTPIYIALDDDALTSPEKLTLYYEWSDKIRAVVADGYREIDAAAALDDERLARKIAHKLRRTVTTMLAQYHQAEADRAEDEAELHREIDRYWATRPTDSLTPEEQAESDRYWAAARTSKHATFEEFKAAFEVSEASIKANGRDDVPVWDRPEPEPINDLSDPVDLWGSFDPPELPPGLLPEVIEDYARALAKVMGADPAGLATGALTVCAAAVPDSIQLKMKKHSDAWRVSARIWFGQIGDPSTKKSPMRNQVLAPLKTMQAEATAAFAAEMKVYEGLSTDDQKNTDKPTCVRYMLDNTTLEAAQDALRFNPQGILICPDELSGWIAAMDKYSSGGKGNADRGPWLSIRNGGLYPVDRVSRGAFMIPNWSACLFGGIQPDVIRRIVDDSYDDGFLQRMFLIVLREASVGQDVPIPDVAEKYDALVRRLATLSPRSIKWNLDPDRGVLKFDDKEQELRNQMEAKHHGWLKLKTINKKLAGHIGKLDGFFGELCVLFHTIKHAHDQSLPSQIRIDTAQRVADFMEHFLFPHALCFFAGMLGLTDNHDELTSLAGYILAHKKTRMSHRDVKRGSRVTKRLDHFASTKLYEQLEALGWVTRAVDSRGREANYWNVNPKVHTLFAERAKRERLDRQEARELLISMAAATKNDNQR